MLPSLPSLVNVTALELNIHLPQKTINAIELELKNTSHNHKRWIREFFIHFCDGSSPLWLPVSNPYVQSLLNSQIIRTLGFQGEDINGNIFCQYELSPTARMAALRWSTAAYCSYMDRYKKYPKGVPINLFIWSEVTTEVLPNNRQGSLRNRVRTFLNLDYNHSSKFFPPGVTKHLRPDFFISDFCKQINGDPIGNVIKMYGGKMPDRVPSSFGFILNTLFGIPWRK